MAALTYSDFNLELERTEQGYRARARSPAGEAQEDLVSPLAGLDLEQFLSQIGRRNRGLPRDVHLPSPSERELKDALRTFGAGLFERFFAGRVGDMFRASLDKAREPGNGLRIRLHLAGAPELAKWPWEFLFDSIEDDFAARSTNIPLVRYLQAPQPIQPLAVSPPLKILAIIAKPPALPELDVEEEWRTLKDSLKGLEEQGSVALDRLETATVAALQRQLGLADYHIIHFIGHGDLDAEGGEGILLMENGSPQGRLLGIEELRTLLRDERQTLRLVILNACKGARLASGDPFAGLAQGLTGMGIPAVIAMQFALSDDAAITFAQVFYSWVAEGYPVEAALGEARKAISVLPRTREVNELEWGAPVLFMRAGEGQIFTVAVDQAGRQIGSPGEQTSSPEAPLAEPAPSGQPGPAAFASGSTLPRIDPGNPPTSIIRQLVTAAFTPENLRRFCQDNPTFRPVFYSFGPKFGLDDMVDEVITFCSTGLLWDTLLAEISRINPAQYAYFESRLYGPAPVSAGPSPAIAFTLADPRIQGWFVNRTKQRGLFIKMLELGVQKQIMLVEAPSGMGKSWLINWLRAECSKRQVPVSHLNLEQLVTDASLNYLGIVREARDQLGPAYFNAMTKVINANTSGGVSQAGQADDAVVQDSLGLVLADSDQVRRQIKVRILDAFFNCLRAIPQGRVVFLLDAYENLQDDLQKVQEDAQNVRRNAREWVERELLSRICRGELPNVLVGIAGRQVPRLDSPDLHLSDWSKFVIPPPPKLTELELFSPDDVADYLRQRKITTLDPKSLSDEKGVIPGELAAQVENALLFG